MNEVKPDSEPEQCAMCGCSLRRYSHKPASFYFCSALCQEEWNYHRSPFGSDPNQP